jgi:hypothetical protein
MAHTYCVAQDLTLKPKYVNWQLIVKGKNNFPNPRYPIEVGTTVTFEAARILGAFQAAKLPQLKIFNAYNFAQNYIANGNMAYINEDDLERTIKEMKAIV